MGEFGSSKDFPPLSGASGKPMQPKQADDPVNFTDLHDAFPNYNGKGGQFLKVKADELGLETGVGVQGVQGVIGTQGTNGTQGIRGTQGLTGIQGVQGIQGTSIQGFYGLSVQGTAGIQGFYGVQGTQGIQGISGVSNYFNGIKFHLCLVRNYEMNNSLSTAASSVMTISNKVGQVLTVNNMPDYSMFDRPGWVAILCDEDKTSAPDGSGGDYLYRDFCVVDRTAHTLTFDGGVDLTNWEYGDRIALYNPLLNYNFVGDQTSAPIVSASGAPAWRAGYSTNCTSNGPMFRHSDGRLIVLFIGYEYAAGAIRGRLGYVSSSDFSTWTIGNTDNYVLNYTDIPDCASLTIGGAATPCNDGTGRYWSVIFYGRISDGHGELRILYYDEDLTTFTYSDPILTDAGLGYAGTSIIKIGNYYHLMVNYLHPSGYVSRVVQAFKSSALEGPYVWYQDIATSSIGVNNETPWSDHTDPGVFFDDGYKVFGLFGGNAYGSNSATKGNRQYVLIEFDMETETWSISTKGAVLINPQYFSDIDSSYPWASDHCGGYPSIFIDGRDVYCTFTMKGSVYQMALVRLNYHGVTQ